MTWEEKLEAMQELGGDGVHLVMRKPGDWYVSSSVYVGGDGLLCGEYGNGMTPEQAVEENWFKWTKSLPYDKYLVVQRPTEKRYRWSGHMWKELPR